MVWSSFGCAFKLTEYLFVCFTDDVGENVQPAAVGHADHHFLHIMIGRGIDDGVESGNGGFTSFERKSFLANIFGVEEFFKHHTLVQFFQNPFLLFKRNGLKPVFLHFVGQPIDFFLVTDVFEFNTYMGCIALLQVIENVTQGGCAQADQVAREEILVQVFFGKAEKTKVEVGIPVLPGADRVGFSDQVALVPVAEDQPVCPKFLFPLNTVGGGFNLREGAAWA